MEAALDRYHRSYSSYQEQAGPDASLSRKLWRLHVQFKTGSQLPPQLSSAAAVLLRIAMMARGSDGSMETLMRIHICTLAAIHHFKALSTKLSLFLPSHPAHRTQVIIFSPTCEISLDFVHLQ